MKWCKNESHGFAPIVGRKLFAGMLRRNAGARPAALHTGIGITRFYYRDARFFCFVREIASAYVCKLRYESIRAVVNAIFRCHRKRHAAVPAIRLRADEKMSFSADEVISTLLEPLSRREITSVCLALVPGQDDAFGNECTGVTRWRRQWRLRCHVFLKVRK